MTTTLSFLKNSGFVEFTGVRQLANLISLPLLPQQATVSGLGVEVSGGSIAGRTKNNTLVWSSGATTVAAMTSFHGSIAKINDSSGWVVLKNALGDVLKLSKLNFLTGALTDTVTLVGSPAPAGVLGITLVLGSQRFYNSLNATNLSLLPSGNLILRSADGGASYEFTTAGASVAQLTGQTKIGTCSFSDTYGNYGIVSFQNTQDGVLVGRGFDSGGNARTFVVRLGGVNGLAATATTAANAYLFGDLVCCPEHLKKSFFVNELLPILREGITANGGYIE